MKVGLRIRFKTGFLFLLDGVFFGGAFSLLYNLSNSLLLGLSGVVLLLLLVSILRKTPGMKLFKLELVADNQLTFNSTLRHFLIWFVLYPIFYLEVMLFSKQRNYLHERLSGVRLEMVK